MLRKILASIRTYHFAELVGHIDDGTTGIAVPVFDGNGLTIAGLGVVVDSEHHVGGPAIMQALRTASAGITKDLEAAGKICGGLTVLPSGSPFIRLRCR